MQICTKKILNKKCQNTNGTDRLPQAGFTTFRPLGPLGGTRASPVEPNSSSTAHSSGAGHSGRLSVSPQRQRQRGFCLSLASAGRKTQLSRLQFSSHWQPLSLQSSVAAACLPQPTPRGRTRAAYGPEGAKRLVRMRMRGLRNVSARRRALELPPSKATGAKGSVSVERKTHSLVIGDWKCHGEAS